MKHITITNGGYIDSLPLASASPDAVRRGTRRTTIQRVYELAERYGWAIRVAGQHWS